MSFFSFFRRTPEATCKVVTFRGVANGWQPRGYFTAERSCADAVRFHKLISRIQPQLIHKVVSN